MCKSFAFKLLRSFICIFPWEQKLNPLIRVFPGHAIEPNDGTERCGRQLGTQQPLKVPLIVSVHSKILIGCLKSQTVAILHFILDLYTYNKVKFMLGIVRN